MGREGLKGGMTRLFFFVFAAGFFFFRFIGLFGLIRWVALQFRLQWSVALSDWVRILLLLRSQHGTPPASLCRVSSFSGLGLVCSSLHWSGLIWLHGPDEVACLGWVDLVQGWLVAQPVE